MHRSKRIEHALQHLRTHEQASIAELARLLQCSQTTVRSDMDTLAALGSIERLRGGVRMAPAFRSMPMSSGMPGARLQISHPALKEALCAEAARLVAPGDTVFIGGGTTPYLFSQHLHDMQSVQVVTTCVNIAIDCTEAGMPVYFIGGEPVQIDGLYYSGGPKIRHEAQGIMVDKAFIGVSGIHHEAGLTIYDLSQFTVYQAVRSMAKVVVLLCDKTKFDAYSAHRVGAVKPLVDVIVTNKGIPSRYVHWLEKEQVQLIQTEGSPHEI